MMVTLYSFVEYSFDKWGTLGHAIVTVFDQSHWLCYVLYQCRFKLWRSLYSRLYATTNLAQCN